MTLEQLRCFLALAQEKHFTRAAERVYLSQPAFSLQIKKLEAEFGAILFDRKSRQLTELGEEVARYARKIMETVQELRAIVQGEEHLFDEPLRLGAIPTLAPYLLPKLLPRILHLFPRLQMVIEEGTTTVLLQKLEKGELDAALIASLEGEGLFQIIPIFREEFMAYVSPQHPLYQAQALSPGKIPLEDTWLLEEGHCFREQVLTLCRAQGTGQRVDFRSGNLETLILMVEEIGGLTLLPEVTLWTLSPDKRIHLRLLAPPGAGRTVYLALRQGSLKRSLALRLAEEIRAGFQLMRSEA